MSVDAVYDREKAFFSYITKEILPLTGMPEEDRPIAVLERFEKLGSSVARKSLTQGIHDCLAMTATMGPEKVRALDQKLLDLGIATLSEIRYKYWKKLKSIIKRGLIKNESEYYAILCAKDYLIIADPGSDELRVVQRMLEEFEK